MGRQSEIVAEAGGRALPTLLQTGQQVSHIPHSLGVEWCIEDLEAQKQQCCAKGSSTRMSSHSRRIRRSRRSEPKSTSRWLALLAVCLVILTLCWFTMWPLAAVSKTLRDNELSAATRMMTQHDKVIEHLASNASAAADSALNSSPPFNSEHTKKKSHELRPAHGVPWRLKIMGPVDSGTNLLEKLLQNNLGHEMINIGGEWDKHNSCLHVLPSFYKARENTNTSKGQFACSDTWYGSGVDKHTMPEGKYMDRLMNESNTIILATVRSPLAEIDSWIKAPYMLDTCIRQRRLYGLPGSLCELCSPTAPHPFRRCEYARIYKEDFVPKKYESAAAIYNAYLSGYLKYQSAEYRAQMLIVPYEKLLLQPAEVIRSVLKAMRVEERMPAKIQLVDSPAKNHGKANGREDSLTKLREKTYVNSLRKLSKDLPERYCALFDRPMLAKIMESTSPQARSYDADCEEILDPPIKVDSLRNATSVD